MDPKQKQERYKNTNIVAQDYSLNLENEPLQGTQTYKKLRKK